VSANRPAREVDLCGSNWHTRKGQDLVSVVNDLLNAPVYLYQSGELETLSALGEEAQAIADLCSALASKP